mgnify:CR=1 FL=1
MFIKLSAGDDPKVLHAYDRRVSFLYSEVGPDKLQVLLIDRNASSRFIHELLTKLYSELNKSFVTVLYMLSGCSRNI